MWTCPNCKCDNPDTICVEQLIIPTPRCLYCTAPRNGVVAVQEQVKQIYAKYSQAEGRWSYATYSGYPHQYASCTYTMRGVYDESCNMDNYHEEIAGHWLESQKLATS